MEETPPRQRALSSTFPSRSAPACWPRSGAHPTAIFLPSTSSGRPPTAIAAVLFCARSSVYRTVRAHRGGTLGLEHDEQEQLAPPVRTTVLVPTLRRSLLALLKAAPRDHGCGRTRWSCATSADTLQATRGIRVSAETMRRGVHQVGWVWKPKGIPGEVMPPGPHEMHDLAGALELATATLGHAVGARKTHEWFRYLLQVAGATVVPIAKGAFDRVGTGTGGWQKTQLKSGDLANQCSTAFAVWTV